MILLLALALSSIAAETKSQTKAKAPPPPQGTTAPQDVQLEAAIRARLAKSVIGKDGLTVRVQGGVAYWDGKTDVIQHKGAATRMARTAGAAAVVNNIQISDAARRKAAHNLTGTTPRAQVKHADPVAAQSK